MIGGMLRGIMNQFFRKKRSLWLAGAMDIIHSGEFHHENRGEACEKGGTGNRTVNSDPSLTVLSTLISPP